MRCSLLLVAACAYTNVDAPIGVVSRDLSDEDAANLAEGAQCWNLELGTHYVTGDDARATPQQVDGFYDFQTCLDAAAQTQIGYPSSIAVCPERYWSAVVPRSILPATPFRVLSHELGHELNIVGHPDNPLAVMNGGTLDFDDMFAAVDIQLFDDANPGFVHAPACTRVVRSVRPFTQGAIGHCACDVGPLDMRAPITLVLPAGSRGDALATAATCWNLRYGLQLRVGADDGGQAISLDPGCSSSKPIRDRDHVLACTHTPTVAFDALFVIANALGVEAFDPAPFGPDQDARVMEVLGLGVRCHQLVQDAGACTCRDPLGV